MASLLRRTQGLFAFIVVFVSAAAAQDFHAHMRILHQTGAKKDSNAHVVVWLTPLDRQVAVAPMQHVRLIQRDKRFIPHLIVITAGTKVEFPNEDPFFHNVFSLYKGKRFDLGLYEAGTSRSVEFDRPGVSFIFCNIHPEMSGLVLVLDTPYFAQSDKTGDITIRGVPPGKYRVEVWFERSSEEALNRLSRDISLPAQRELGTLDIPEVVPENVPHKNKYGNDYDQNELYKQ